MQTEHGIVYQFGAFEVNPASGELLKDGRRIRLQELPHRLLVALLENAGEVISREELRSRLWHGDTFVDFDSSLRVAVGKLREALEDDADNPRYIETIPKRGYRFLVTEVRRVNAAHEAAEPREDPEPLKTDATPVTFVDVDHNLNRGAHRREMWLKIGAGVLALSMFALAALVAYRRHRQQSPQEQAALTAVPFTALPGRATNPAFSPEGSRIAFAWNGDPPPGTRGFDLYVKALGGEALLRLTQHPSEWINPEWSPDGTRIAFKRVAGADTGIYVVPALGGPEQKLRSTRVFDSSIASESSISWSPDGKWIAFPDVVPEEKHTRIYLLSMETMETKQIPINPSCVGESQPAFSHNGEYLAYLCFRNYYEAQLFSLPLPGGKAKLIAPFWPIANGLTWSADDKKLVYSVWKGRGSDELGEVTVANGSVKRFALEGSAEFPNVSPKGDKLAYASISASSNIWRRDLLHSEAPAVELIRSSRAQYDAQYSPDGKHIAFASLRSGVQGVWISDEDGSNLVGTSDPNYLSGNPQWSPDGRKVAFYERHFERSEIYVADVADRKPRKLVTNISGLYRPRWSHDGKWIYFNSDEPGRAGVYRCPASGGDATALSKDIHGIAPQESFDGKTVYFASGAEKSTLKKVSLPGQPARESEVDGSLRLLDSRLWVLSPGGIYFVPAEAPRSVRYFDFASKQIRPIFELDKSLGYGLSLSPDGRWILYSQEGDVTGDIMLVDHFH